jgi:phosphosulfolactate phosphohydrolase-like enzyme
VLVGQELLGRGLIDDVAYASEVDVSSVVPILRDGAFRAADDNEFYQNDAG